MEAPLSASPSIGGALSRVDGRLKVTGQARYAAEYAVPGCVHGVLVTAVLRGGTSSGWIPHPLKSCRGCLALSRT